MTVREDIPLAPLTTFRMGPTARYLIEIRTKEELPEAFAFINEKQLPFFILGGGSNTIFTAPERFESVVLKIAIPGFEVVDDTDAGAIIRVGAGEDWDGVVERAVAFGLSGIEAMSAIPGLAGATPIQNVGAYGVEIADVLESVEAYDYVNREFKILTPSECGFSYRDSLFKHEKRYIITAITLGLSKGEPRVPDYPGVKAYFDPHNIAGPTLAEIRDAIIEIRRTKLPDPKDIASVGSFFKNPFVTEEAVARLRNEFEHPVVFEQDDGRYKVGAGWLIDTLGLKGKSFGNLGFYKNNALVITNDGDATYGELAELVEDTRRRVRERFSIELEPEPTLV
ncbi:MAG: UDP-N-acetylmuramate dehydrogenase [Candidatus Parcubacteria bacterium]|jgi:UDP-N-acetylmuramate dehydrogenase|nr:UDP-N-acetylmuramate dehydrogenase [Candidatus Parcubacteria bacterium]